MQPGARTTASCAGEAGESPEEIRPPPSCELGCYFFSFRAPGSVPLFLRFSLHILQIDHRGKRAHNQFSPIGGTAAVHTSRDTCARVSHSESFAARALDSAVYLSLALTAFSDYDGPYSGFWKSL